MVAMMSKLEKSTRAGSFTISPGKEVYGELTLAGENTSLYLRDSKYFNTASVRALTGVLHDLTKVTLVHCATAETGSRTRGQEEYHYANVFPHYVVLGDRHIAPDERTILEIIVVVDDANTLFYDFNAFGRVADPHRFIGQIVDGISHKNEIVTGPEPEVLYFTGRREIFSADTVLGRVSAFYKTSYNRGGADGIGLTNTISISISFGEAATFKGAIDRTLTLLRFLQILAGRRQNILRLDLRTERADLEGGLLQVYWSLLPKRRPSLDEQRLHPLDILVDAVRKPDAFVKILCSWLDRDSAWRDARSRFSGSFSNERSYDLDRLIASVNMFDILPESAVPTDIQLPEDLKSATERCQVVFKKLPQSPERDSVLSAFGRLGKSSLKRKIRHRAQLIVDMIGERFPKLFEVTDEAVNCRNHYVHGGEPRFDYNIEFNTVVYFTETMEFVFAASDLIEAGWDAKTWSETSMTVGHPFALYRSKYKENLSKLESLLTSARG